MTLSTLLVLATVPKSAQAQPAPPPAYPPPPVYGYPPPYWRPPPQPATPPRVLPYRAGEAPPPGYEVQDRANKLLLIIGGATFGAVWLASIATVGTFAVIDDTSNVCIGLGECDPPKPRHQAWPLLIPLAGPWAALGTLHPNSDGVLALIGLGIGQAGGLTTFIIGLADTRRVWARAAREPRIMPWVTAETVGVRATF